MNTTDNAPLGLGILVLSGMMTASFPVPMKISRQWKWENTWLVYATMALIVMPVAIATRLFPDLVHIYASVPIRGLLPPLIFGFCWGIAQLTFGLAIAIVGMAMSFAIVIGLSAVVGSVIPLAVFHIQDLLGHAGLILLVSTLVLAVGLVLYGKAGQQRELEAGSLNPLAGNFKTGLLLCVFTGCFGAMLNLGFVFGTAITSKAIAGGASSAKATFAVWAVVLAAGYLPSLFYSCYLIRKNRSLRLFRNSTAREGLLASLAAALWLFGMLGYGVGGTIMGALGTSIGFAICQTVLLLWSTALGLMAGEWGAAAPATRRRMHFSVAVIILSMSILSLGTLTQ